MTQLDSPHPGLALGGIFLSLFGACWLVGASYQYQGANGMALAGIALLAIAIVAWAMATFRARRRHHAVAVDAAARKRMRTALMVVNAAQWSLVGLAVLVMNVTGHPDWIMPSVIFLVGAHFLPLAKIFQYRGYYVTAACLMLVAVLDRVAAGDARHTALSQFATGAVLWASAVALLSAMRPRSPKRSEL